MKEIKNITYSDGNVEEEILEILKEASDLSSLTNIAQDRYDSWPIRYHLTSLRGNLVRHLNFQNLDILEFGAGMGGVSRCIAESANHLTIVEGTKRRYEAATKRLRDLSNWDGYISNYQDFQSEKKYDVVCFIGVWEYAELYLNKKDPFLWAIKHAKSFLKENGVLLLAVENKNGLKYFSGATEDHFGKHFYGICGYPNEKSVKTFSLKEMKNFFYNAGFNNIVTQFPYPDYKLPRAILTEKMINTNPKIAGQIMGSYPSEDYGGLHKELFPESLAYNSLANSGLLSEMSNSFLFLVSKMRDSPIMQLLLSEEIEKDINAWLYALEREFPIRTIILNKDNQLISKKQFLKEDARKNYFNDVFVINGENLATCLTRSAYFKEYDVFEKELLDFFRWSFNKYSINENELAPIAIDALAHNTIVTKNGYEQFDFEYVLNNSIKKSWFILRQIFNFEITIKYLNYKNYREMYCHYCSLLNVKEQYKVDALSEQKFYNKVTSNIIELNNAPYQIANMGIVNRLKKVIKKIITGKKQ